MSRSKKLPTVLNEQEQTSLLDQPNPRYPTGQRNLCMLRMMLNAGLRLSETTALLWKHLDLMTGKVEVREGKGAKDRFVWIGERDLELLRDWRDRQQERVGESVSYVFSTLQGNRVQNRYVQQMVTRYTEKAGIEKNVSPHTLRHTFATDLYRATKNIRQVQKALGHADLSTTMIYTHVVDEDLEESMKTFRR